MGLNSVEKNGIVFKVHGCNVQYKPLCKRLSYVYTGGEQSCITSKILQFACRRVTHMLHLSCGWFVTIK